MKRSAHLVRMLTIVDLCLMKDIQLSTVHLKIEPRRIVLCTDISQVHLQGRDALPACKAVEVS
jgi:hypothetical protein